MSEAGETEGLLTATELAVKIKWSVRSVRKGVADRTIPFMRLGKSVRFYYPDVLAALRKSAEAECRAAAKEVE